MKPFEMGTYLVTTSIVVIAGVRPLQAQSDHMHPAAAEPSEPSRKS